MSMMVSFVLSFFPRDVLDEILNLIESVSEDFPSYSYIDTSIRYTLFSNRSYSGIYVICVNIGIIIPNIVPVKRCCLVS